MICCVPPSPLFHLWSGARRQGAKLLCTLLLRSAIISGNGRIINRRVLGRCWPTKAGSYPLSLATLDRSLTYFRLCAPGAHYIFHVAELSIAYATHVSNHCNVVPLGWFKSVKTTAPSTRNLQKRKGGSKCRAMPPSMCRAMATDDDERRDDRQRIELRYNAEAPWISSDHH